MTLRPRMRTALKWGFAGALALGGLGIACLMTAFFMTEPSSRPLVVGVGGAALLVLGALWVAPVTFSRLLQRDLQLAKGSKELGLIEVWPDAAEYDYNSLFLDSQRLVIALNDGRTSLSTHRDRLRRRLSDPNMETTIFLIDPRSPMLAVLARKGSIEPAALEARITEAVQLVQEVRTPDSHLEILGHSLFNPHAVFLGDEHLVVTPYFASRGGRTVPAFVYEDTGPESYYQKIAADLEALRMDARQLGGSDGQRGQLRAI